MMGDQQRFLTVAALISERQPSFQFDFVFAFFASLRFTNSQQAGWIKAAIMAGMAIGRNPSWGHDGSLTGAARGCSRWSVALNCEREA